MRGKKKGRFNVMYEANIIQRFLSPAEMESFHADYEDAKMVNVGRFTIVDKLKNGDLVVRPK